MMKVSEEELSKIKFSPDGKTLAVASHDNAIYLFNFDTMKKKCKKLNKHSSYITAFDFSEDGDNIRSTCGAYELLFWDINSGK